MRVTPSYGITQSDRVSLFGPDYTRSLDVEIKKLEDALVADNADNRRWCMYRDAMVYSTVNMFGTMLAGKKINVNARRKKDTERIKLHNNRMNFAGETLEDVVRNTWIDCVREGWAAYRPWKTRGLPGGMDLSRVDPTTLQRVIHPETGHVIYVQQGWRWPDFPQPTTPADFAQRYDVYNVPREEAVYTIIPEDPRNLVSFRLFDQAPISTVVPLVVYKKWIIWYMRKHAQKYWSPFTVVSLGKDGYLPNEGQYLYYKQQMESVVPNMYNFSGVVVPGWIDMQQMSSTGAKDGALYTATLDWLNSEIVAGIIASMQMREASGKEGKAAAKETTGLSLGTLESCRAVLERRLCEYYAYTFIGDEDPADFDVEWPIVRYESLLDSVVAAERAAGIGAVDNDELRRMLRYAYDFIDPHRKIVPADTFQERQMAVQQEMAEKAAAAKGVPGKKPSGKNKDPGTQSEPGTRPTAARTSSP